MSTSNQFEIQEKQVNVKIYTVAIVVTSILLPIAVHNFPFSPWVQLISGITIGILAAKIENGYFIAFNQVLNTIPFISVFYFFALIDADMALDAFEKGLLAFLAIIPISLGMLLYFLVDKLVNGD